MKKIAIFLVLSFLIAGCATNSIQTEGKVPSDPGETKGTYGWLENAVPSDDIRVNNEEIDRMVRNSVEKHLATRGYVRVEQDQADYLLSWFGNITDEVKELSLSSFYARNGYTGLIGTMPKNVKGGKVKKVFSRGTLILDVMDRKTQEVIWRGSATNIIHEKMPKGRKAQYVDASIKKILEDLPQR